MGERHVRIKIAGSVMHTFVPYKIFSFADDKLSAVCLQPLDFLCSQPGILCDDINGNPGMLKFFCNLALFLCRAFFKTNGFALD